MRLVLISDTHNKHKHLTSAANFPNSLVGGDLLIHAGDFSGVGKQSEVENFLEWCVKVEKNYTHGIVFIAGNHDRSFDSNIDSYVNEYEETKETNNKPEWLVSILSDVKSNNSIHYLENTSISIDGINIWGSPITPWFYGEYWAFNKHRGPEIREVWDQIPDQTDVVVTHGPISYKLDYIPYQGKYVGCEDLRVVIEKKKPLIHVSGHIHEAYGYDYNVDTHFYNAAICNSGYSPVNKPWVVDVDWKEKEVKH